MQNQKEVEPTVVRDGAQPLYKGADGVLAKV